LLRPQEEDAYLILASDGVWEFIDNQEAIMLVDGMYKQGKSADEACRLLILKAAIAWRTNEGDYRDDITAIVIYLQEAVQSVEKRARLQAS